MSLPPCLLLVPVDDLLPGATGALIWVPWQPTTAPLSLAMHPALLVQTAAAPLQGACVEPVLCLPLHDVLHQHIALVLQATITAEDVAGQLNAATLTEALGVCVAVGRFVHDCNICRMNATDNTRPMQYLPPHAAQSAALPYPLLPQAQGVRVQEDPHAGE